MHPLLGRHTHASIALDRFNHEGGDCICGSATCPWWSAIESCWFTPFLPDLDWHNDDVASAVTEDVLYWLAPQLSESDLGGHIEGLTRLLESQFVVRDRKIDIHLTWYN